LLKDIGAHQVNSGFGGGAGEQQYASFLVEAQARAIVDGKGIGISDIIVNAYKGKDERHAHG